MSRRKLPNPHPGEILNEEFLKPMGISQSALARAIGVAPRRKIAGKLKAIRPRAA